MKVELQHIDFFRSILPVRGSLETMRKSSFILKRIELDFKTQFPENKEYIGTDIVEISFTKEDISFLSQQIQIFDNGNAILLEALPLIEQILQEEANGI